MRRRQDEPDLRAWNFAPTASRPSTLNVMLEIALPKLLVLRLSRLQVTYRLVLTMLGAVLLTPLVHHCRLMLTQVEMSHRTSLWTMACPWLLRVPLLTMALEWTWTW